MVQQAGVTVVSLFMARRFMGKVASMALRDDPGSLQIYQDKAVAGLQETPPSDCRVTHTQGLSPGAADRDQGSWQDNGAAFHGKAGLHDYDR